MVAAPHLILDRTNALKAGSGRAAFDVSPFFVHLLLDENREHDHVLTMTQGGWQPGMP